MIYARITTRKRHEDLARYLEGTEPAPLSAALGRERARMGAAVDVRS
jgi:hypothetical protein